MTQTYTPLANITLGTAAASITFGSIPATYRDLVIVFQGTVVSGTAGVRMRLNGDTGTNYSFLNISGNGAATSSANGTIDSYARVQRDVDATTTTALQTNINIMDYSATDKHKTVISRNGNASLGTEGLVSRWANTAAITTVLVYSSSANFAIGTTVSLYGIVS